MNGFDRDLMDRLLKFNYHLNIFNAENNTLSDVKKVVDKIGAVENSSFVVQTQIFVKIDKYVYPIYVKGIDFDNELERKSFFSYVKEDSKTEGFFVGEGLRSRLPFDDKIEYYPLDKTFKLKTANIRGSFRMGLYDIDNAYIITDLQTARNLSENYTLSLGIRFKDPYAAGAVKAALKQQFPNIYISSWTDNQILLSALKLEKLTMFVLLSLITLVASFNIFATLTVKVVEKTKDIGILKALGFTSRRILAVFSLQGLLLGFIGVLSGTVLGLGLCLLIQKYHFVKIPVDIYTIEYLPVAINYSDIFLIALLGLLFAFVSSLFPALRAARLLPSEALRYE
jgi:lipoprotein-releasing system permease protein